MRTTRMRLSVSIILQMLLLLQPGLRSTILTSDGGGVYAISYKNTAEESSPPARHSFALCRSALSNSNNSNMCTLSHDINALKSEGLRKMAEAKLYTPLSKIYSVRTLRDVVKHGNRTVWLDVNG